MKKILIAFFTCVTIAAQAQELYVSSDPASNVPAKSLGMRLTNKFFKMEHDGRNAFRFEPELMYGINRQLMVRVTGYMSNAMQQSTRFEGGSVYAKYRFLSQDEPHSHFRMAAYVKGSVIDNPFVPAADGQHNELNFANDELDLEGNASGVSGGIIATKLVHKLAVSGTLGYNRFTNNIKNNLTDNFSRNMMNYSLSFGYLTLPVTYKSYEQTNMNLYVEFLGKANVDNGVKGNYVDIAPAVQFIFNSTTRLDLSYRWELAGNMVRNMPNSFTVRMEHNIFNAFKHK
ncbi:hypothetical protein MKQ68_16255 [Chitinophaga horti]|uniref:MetA-pathway of phenol degradation n=1 Tax=Chitinophaga horti TaxID=2920382 RepID=A0ABY6IZ08_9BACT|nr:hypothetical protein [Chitinophaga horti]UYQ91642.1 hypothetical protein MKQ68_16255 [Chitinophaga horti]